MKKEGLDVVTKTNKERLRKLRKAEEIESSNKRKNSKF